MSCQDPRYNGRFGRDARQPTASYTLPGAGNQTMDAGDVVHSTTNFSFSCCSRDDNEYGTIRGALIKVNNADVAAVTTTFRLYLFNNSDLSAQTYNTAMSLDATDWTGLQAVIDFSAARATHTYHSEAQKQDLYIKYRCAASNTYLYGILITTDGCTLDQVATIDIYLNVERD